MAMLQCEVCGGKLVGKPGGIFECEYCGLQYDTAWAKAKIQEIKGTVQVEGTVEVTGTVKVEGGVSVESLLKRIHVCAQDKEDNRILDLAQQVLTMDSECGEAYLWLLMAEKKVFQEDDLFQNYSRKYLNALCEHKHWKNAMRFLPQADAERLSEKLKDKLAYWEKENPLIQQRYEQIQPVQELVHEFYGGGIAALKADGSVYVSYVDDEDWLSPVAEWNGIQKLVSDRLGLLLGLGWDGKVRAVCDKQEENEKLLNAIASWYDIVALGIDDKEVVVGLRKDGTLVSVYLDPYQNEGTYAYAVYKEQNLQVHYALDAAGWTDVKHLNVVECSKDGFSEICYFVLGLTSDGRIRVSDVSAISDMEDYWEQYDQIDQYRNVKKHCWGTTYLFRDGTVRDLISGEEESGGPYLDYYITQNGITDIGTSGYGYEVRDAVVRDSHVALLADGRIAAGPATHHAKNVVEADPWKKMVYVEECHMGKGSVVGIREDGVVLLAWEETVNDYVSVLLAQEEKEKDGISVEGWKLFGSLDTFDQEREAGRRRAEEARRIEEEKCRIAEEQRRIEEEKRAIEKKQLEEEKKRIEEQKADFRRRGLCQHCGGTFKGMFTKKCSICGKEKDY